MALQNFHTEEMSLLLSSDAKPRLKWTPELHQQFVDAVNQLGGAEKATPKSLMRVMGIRGLTLYHLKSHLQKYRLGMSQHLQTYHQNRQKNHGDKQRSHFTGKIYRGAKERINESLQITQALQKQMEVQRKLNEQIEVQRHLQLRMKAQGKYLQSVLRKAQEMLSENSSSTIEVEHVKAQLSQLVSMVDSGCESCSFSVLTESEGSILNDKRTKTIGHNGCSLESSLTSSESSWRKGETQPKHQVEENRARGKGKVNGEKRNSGVLSLMEMHPVEKFGSGSQAKNRKRSKSAVDEVNNIEQSTSEKWSGEQSSYEQVQKFRLWENNDLNCESLNEFDSVPKVIDLNHKVVEVFNGNLV